MYGLLSLALCASSVLAAEHIPAIFARQSSNCAEIGADSCEGYCIPSGYNCCANGTGCQPGYYCVANGCCPNGERCSGSGGTRTDWVDVTTTYTSTSTSTISDEATVTNTQTDDDDDEETVTATSTSTSSHPVIPTWSESEPTQTPSHSTPVPPEFTGGQSSLRPAVGAVAGLIVGAVLL
ncbi:uncharacterized protein BDV17DRAFT_269631 [Aspergillus undulatus]|uniref:uncharacterized protein n=1 Tax=Aspergillus undulatus TaxID=1810928 RepID=UPI003CCD1BEC